MSNILNIKHHRYKLNENSKVDRSSVNGIILTRDWCHGLMNPRRELDSFIMTNANPEGFIDYEIYIPATKEIIYNNREAMSRNVPVYDLTELMMMNRNDLVYVAEYYGLDVAHKSNQFLISLIVKLQKQRAEKDGIPAPDNITPAQVANEIERQTAKKRSEDARRKQSSKEVW